MTTDTRLIPILEKINFTSRYQKILDQYVFRKDAEVVSNETTSEILKEYGYVFKYNKSESFFRLVEKKDNVVFQFTICFKHNLLELIWQISHKGEWLGFGWGPWGTVMVELVPDWKITMACFRNEQELRDMLLDVFAIYEDFKKEVLHQLST